MNITISANAVAWYAAIVVTGSVCVAGYAIWRDRARIKVSAQANMRVTPPDGPQDDDDTYIIITVANRGRRAVHLRTWPWFTQKGDKGKAGIVKGYWLPNATVDEGRSATHLARQASLPFPLKHLKRVCVQDETGRVWKGKIK